MKKIKNIVLLLVLALFTLTITNCNKDKEDKTKGNINVSLAALSGETVDVNGLSVELHNKATFDDEYSSTTSSGGAAKFEDIPNGTYYLVAWKDNDGDSDYSSGDFFGFHDAPIVIEGANFSTTVEIYKVD